MVMILITTGTPLVSSRAWASVPTKSPARAEPSTVAYAVTRSVSLWASPTARKPFTTLHNPTAIGGPLVFLASNTALEPSWVRVYVPLRPDGSQAWIHDDTVRLYSDNYLVWIQTSSHKLTVFAGLRTILTAPVGVGRSVLPTPNGTYYIVELLKQPDPYGAYGPYAFGLSAFSNVLYNFGGGPGEIGLHGTDDPGSVGANVSHGCLRVFNATITKLAGLLPLGTPVIITR